MFPTSIILLFHFVNGEEIVTVETIATNINRPVIDTLRKSEILYLNTISTA